MQQQDDPSDRKCRRMGYTEADPKDTGEGGSWYWSLGTKRNQMHLELV